MEKREPYRIEITEINLDEINAKLREGWIVASLERRPGDKAILAVMENKIMPPPGLRIRS